MHRKLDLYVCMISEELFPCLYIIAVVLRPRQFKSAEHRPNARSAPFSAADPSRRLPPATPSSSCWDLACSHQHHALTLTVLRLCLLLLPLPHRSPPSTSSLSCWSVEARPEFGFTWYGVKVGEDTWVWQGRWLSFITTWVRTHVGMARGVVLMYNNVGEDARGCGKAGGYRL